MQLDWQTIVVSILGAASAAGGVGYLLKKGIERTMERKFDALSENHKASLQASAGRQASLFDMQAEVLKDLTALALRARNVCRDIIDMLESGELRRIRPLRERLCSYISALTELLFEERAMLSVDFQNCKPRLRDAVAILSAQLGRLERRPDNIHKGDRCLMDSRTIAETTFETIDSLYKSIVKQGEEKIGVN
jgi:hypothetical protein